MKKVIKFFASLFTSLIIFSALSPSLIVLANETESDADYEIVQTSDNSLTLFNNENNETISVDIIDNHNAIITDAEGNRNEVYVDDNGNVYLNGILELTQEDLNVQIVRDETLASNDNLRAARATGKRYKYIDTIYYDTKTQGDAMSIVFGMLSFLPYIGPAFTFASIVTTFQNLGEPTMYVSVNRYCTEGYQFYKYVSYFYSNPARTRLVASRVTYKQMW